MKVSVIIPCFNEKKTIKQLIEKVNKINIKKEIIIVDDGSFDGTADILKKIKNIKIIFKKRNEGKGSAIKRALKFIKGDLVLIQDADLEYNPNDYYKLIKPFNNKKIKAVYGSRVLNKKRYLLKRNFFKNFRVFANHLLTFISNILNNQNLTDAHTCYKVFRRKLFLSLKLKEDGFSFCPEVTTKISKLKIKIHEVPISYNGRTVSEGKKIRFVDAISAFTTIIKYKFFN
jgi:glycosyltransferase involved in cell wall biosynthesis